MTLSFLIALTTGARIQTVFTLRKKHFEKPLKEEVETEVKIKVGYGTDCDTKFNKIHTLIFPSWVYQKVRIYLNSPRYKNKNIKIEEERRKSFNDKLSNSFDDKLFKRFGI